MTKTRNARPAPVSLADVRDAALGLRGVSVCTPIQPFRALSDLAGAEVLLKLENLQRAGSFKIRGAYTRMSRLSEPERARGVVAASAGNHAQGVALGAQKLGISAVVYMPVDAPLPKVEATRGYGAEVRLVGKSVDEALVSARLEETRSGRVLIHPFDHPDIVAGQGTVALEILDQVPKVGTVVVPVGGGGLIAGIATVLAAMAPRVKVLGVQAANAAAYPDSLAAGRPIKHPLGATMADGIALGCPGEVPFEIIKRLGVEIRTVSEEQIATALLMIAERAKLVVEPSGAVGVAAVLAAVTDHLGAGAGLVGPLVPVLSGGNIDPLLLMRVMRRGMAAAGRYLVLRVVVDDRPGSLAHLVATVAKYGGNIMDVVHLRMDSHLAVFETVVTLQVETKGHAHCEQIVEQVRNAGFAVLNELAGYPEGP